jgi:hypothetical protein
MTRGVKTIRRISSKHACPGCYAVTPDEDGTYCACCQKSGMAKRHSHYIKTMDRKYGHVNERGQLMSKVVKALPKKKRRA